MTQNGSSATKLISQRNLGAVIGSKEYKDQYCAEEVQGWKGGISTLAEIDRSQPHAAYIVFTKGSTYCLRTVESSVECVDPVQQVIDEMFSHPIWSNKTTPR